MMKSFVCKIASVQGKNIIRMERLLISEVMFLPLRARRC